MKLTITSNSPEQTRDIGFRIGARLEGRDVVFLDGELGSGKTVLTRGIYAGLDGKDEEQVLSPSYTLVHDYIDAKMPIYHIDLYRLEKRDAIFSLDYEEFLFMNPGVTIVEWPRQAKELVEPENCLHIVFQPGETMQDRVIELTAHGDRYLDIFAELSGSC